MTRPTRQAILALLEQTLRDVFFDPTIVIDGSSTAEDVDGWDSLSHVRLLVEIERRFAISIPPLEADRLANVGDLADLIHAKLAT